MSVRGRKLGWIYLFLLPTFVLYGMYTIWPLMVGSYYSLLDWNGFERFGRFVGLANYGELLKDKLFWNSMKVTVLFTLLAVPLRAGLSLILALVLNDRALRGSKVFRTLIFLPVVTTAAIVGIIMNLVFDPAGGPVNLVLRSLGLVSRPLPFLSSAGMALGTSVGIWVWKWLGISLIYWLSSLQSIPEELYEAATIDGAGSAKCFFLSITAPLLRPFAIIILLLTIVDATRVFDLMMTLTGGGPFFRTEVVEIFIYRFAFGSNVPRLGYASAAANLFGLMFGVIAAVQFFIIRRLDRRNA